MKDTHQDLGKLIREYRAKANLTQLDLATRLGYESTQFVSLFERGLSKIPLNVLGQLIVILGIPEKKITDTLMKSYEMNLKSEILHGKKMAKINA